mmetsp:Transcript_38283/g.89731  ORF Transcript_38283/g.89731 Transcript_38283/m.89731 type:complete len:233 (+) Transcript_38283:589-1287(+)
MINTTASSFPAAMPPSSMSFRRVWRSIGATNVHRSPAILWGMTVANGTPKAEMNAHQRFGFDFCHASSRRRVESSVESLSVSGGRSASVSCLPIPRRIMGSMYVNVQRFRSEDVSSACPIPYRTDTAAAAVWRSSRSSSVLYDSVNSVPSSIPIPRGRWTRPVRARSTIDMNETHSGVVIASDGPTSDAWRSLMRNELSARRASSSQKHFSSHPLSVSCRSSAAVMTSAPAV